jgi:hypothetical protein
MTRLFIFLILFAATAKAQPIPSARELAVAKDHAKQAEVLASAGNCKMAVEGFEVAYQTSQDLSILPRLSQCYQILNQYDEALRTACWYEERAAFPQDKEQATQRVEKLSQHLNSSCQKFPKADGSNYAPALRIEKPPKLRRFTWPATFAIIGGFFTAKSLTVENPASSSIGADIAFSSMALSLYSVTEKSRLFPSFWVNTDGTLSANLYLSLPATSISLTLTTQTDGASLLVDITKTSFLR